MKEKILFALLTAAIIAVFILSGNGFYRYRCQDPIFWDFDECKPPICTARKECPEDLIGDGSA